MTSTNLIDQPSFRDWLAFIKNMGWCSIAFAGTTKGMTPGQGVALKDIFRVVCEHVEKWQFHHEDFPGADVEAHHLALSMVPAAKVILHPVTFDYRAKDTVGMSAERDVQPKAMRYSELIFESHMLIVAPSQTSKKNFDEIKMYARRKSIGVIELPPEQRMVIGRIGG